MDSLFLLDCPQTYSLIADENTLLGHMSGEWKATGLNLLFPCTARGDVIFGFLQQSGPKRHYLCW